MCDEKEEDATRQKAEDVFYLVEEYKVYSTHEDRPYSINVNHIDIGPDLVEVFYGGPGCGRGCCPYIDTKMTFPTRYLQQDLSAIREEMEALKSERLALEAAKAQEKARLREIERVVQEKQTLARLLEKYHPELKLGD